MSFPDDWDYEERELFKDLIGDEREALEDYDLQDLFHDALFDQDIGPEERALAYDDLLDYLFDEYDIDFEAEFDWEDYRDWYDSQ